VPSNKLGHQFALGGQPLQRCDLVLGHEAAVSATSALKIAASLRSMLAGSCI
jgi:hypothetical protein